MTDPLARWLQKPTTPDDPLDKWLVKSPRVEQTFQGTYKPNQESVFGDGEDQPSLLEKVAKLPMAIGKSILQSVDVVPELHGGESIPMRSRAARLFNLATIPLPLAAPFKVAKFASIGQKALMAGAGSAVTGGISSAIEGRPILASSASSGILGAGLETGISLFSRGKLRARGVASKTAFADDAKFAHPQQTPFEADDWAITSPQFTQPGRKLPTAANMSRYESAKIDMQNVGQDFTDVHGFRSGSTRPDAAVLLHGADDAKAVSLARKWDQNWVITKRGKYDLERNTIAPIVAKRFDNAILPSDDAVEMLVNGKVRRIAFEFGQPQPINPKAVGYSSRYVKRAGDDEHIAGEPSIAARARLLMSKGLRYTKGTEDFEQFIRAKDQGTYNLASESARQDVDGLGLTALQYRGVLSLIDRQTPHFDKSYKEIIENGLKGNEVELFDDYLAATSKINLDNKILGTQGQLGALDPWKRVEMQQFINDTKNQNPHFDALLDQINQFRRATREWLYESGQYTRDELDELNNNLDSIFPLKEVKAGDDFLSPEFNLGTLTHLDNEVNSPLENIIMETQAVAKLARRGQVASDLVNWFETLDPDIRAIYAEQVAGDPDDILRSVFKLRTPSTKEIGRIVSGVSPLTNQRVSYRLKDESLAEMFTGMEPAERTLYMKIFAPFATILRTAATLTPEFMSKNVLRDWLSGKVTTGASFKQMASGFVSAFTKDAKYQEALAGGGFNGEMLAEDIKLAENLIKRWTGGRNGKEKLIDAVKSPWEALQSFGIALERGTRLGAFHATYGANRAAGLSPEKAVRGAAIATKDFSTDFSMHGSRTTPVRVTAAFWNAMMQGYYRMQEVARKDPKAFMARGLGYITLPSVLLYLKNRTDPEYQQLPSWERTMFWHVKVGNNWHRFPKPFDLGVMFGSLPERVMEALDADDPRVLDEFAADYSKSTSFDLIPLPTLSRPFLENWSNTSFLRQRPIISKAIEDVEPKYQIQPGTSQVAKTLGDWFNQSPVQIDNVIGGLSGGLGRMGGEALTTTYDLGEAIVSSEKQIKNALPTMDPKSTWLIRGFTSQFPRNAEPIDKLYDFVDKARTAAETSSFLEKSLHIDDLLDYTEQKAVLAGMFPDLQDVLTDLGELRAQRAQLYADESLSPREQRRRMQAIDRQMLDIADQVNTAMKPFTKRR
jgi:hypothetical protein